MKKPRRPDVFRFAPECVDGKWRVIDTESGQAVAEATDEDHAYEIAVALIADSTADDHQQV